MHIGKLYISKQGFGWKIDNDVLYRKWPWQTKRKLKYQSTTIRKKFKSFEAYMAYRLKYQEAIEKYIEKQNADIARQTN